MSEGNAVPSWSLTPGERIVRKDLHRRYGGSGQGGIGPSAKSPNVMIFTDPAVGEKHGYHDGWMPDGCFHYTGEGQYGDQRMRSGNASIVNHRAKGRTLRLFQGTSGVVTYLGEFVIDNSEPWYETDAPETGGGPLRKVIVFRLRPVDTEPKETITELGRLLEAASDTVQSIPIEQRSTEKAFVDPNRKPYEAERKESKLVQGLTTYLRGKGHEVCRHQILPAGEARPLFTDLYDKDLGLLVEAKGSVTRENVRMAIGQLADYSRFFANPIRAILVPSEPRSDLLALAQSQGCLVIWPAGDTYVSTQPTLLA